MARALPPRLLTCLTAVLLFLATSGEGIGYRRTCAHHDAATREAAASAEHAHGDHGAAPDESAPSHGDHGPCDCLGNCAVATPQPAPSGGIEGALPVPAVRQSLRRTPVRIVSILRADHIIPFANAPPLA